MRFFLFILLICILQHECSGQTWSQTYLQRDTTNAVDTPQRPYTGYQEFFADTNDVRWPDPNLTNQHGNIAFFRITWYDLSISYADFDFFMNAAIDRGQKVVFAIMTITEGYLSLNTGGAQLAYPVSVHNAMQGEANPDFIFSGNWWPNYNSTSFQTAFAAMEVALRAHCNATFRNGIKYSDAIAARNIDGMGWYGEMHTGGSPISWPTGTRWTLSSMQQMWAAQLAQWREYWHLTFINAGSSNGDLPTGFADWMRTLSTDMGPIGLRWDHVGNTGIYNFEYVSNADANWKTFVSNQWKVAPVMGEPVAFGVSSAGQCDWFHAWTEASVYHASGIENGNMIAPMTVCTNTIALQIGRLMGYRWTIKNVTMTDSIRANGNFNVSPLFANIGIAPDYYPTTITYYLYQGATLVKQWTSAVNPFMVLPGNVVGNDNTTMVGTFSGLYNLYVKFSFNDGYYPYMPLQMSANRTSDGKYLLRVGIAVATTGTPPPPPPPPPPNSAPAVLMGNNQTDTLPKNVDSLTAQINDIDGDVVSYTWTQVSGPNTATLVTPSGTVTTAFQNILTRVTGLIAGTYQFRLTANDGKGGITNGFVNIIVLNVVVVPPPPPPPVYRPPVANAGADTTIQLPASSAFLHGQVVSSDTTIASYSWTKFSGVGGTIATPTTINSNVTGLTAGAYQYRFRVTDNAGNIADDYMTVIVLDVIPNPMPLPGVPQATKISGIKNN